MVSPNSRSRILFAAATVLVLTSVAEAQRDRHFLPNEQGRIQLRDPQTLPPADLPPTPTPPTVATAASVPEWELSLDEAIRVALQNTDVVRVLSGVGAASSGLTIYSPAISNTAIDRARGVFDPSISIQNNFFRGENPNTANSISRSDRYDFSLNLNKRLLNGADAGLRVDTDRSRSRPAFPLDPQSTSNVEFSLSQPLLRGRGVDVNSVPIVLAFIDTERSYFRLKDSLQNLVLGVIQGYWELVQARTEVWVLQQQIRQAEFVNNLNESRLELGIEDIGEVAQARATLANFRANLVAAEATVLNRVASLRGILGIPPGSDFTIVPTTPPLIARLEFDWEALSRLAEVRRPDLIELKLVLEADRQQLLEARNLAHPQLDAFASYGWDGLEGTLPAGIRFEANPGESWSLGVNFSVPLTLRADRANLRQNELILAQDRANLEQGLLQVSHSLAFTLRGIEQLKQQYVAFKQARAAAELSLDLQFEEYRAGRTNFLAVLLAINTWANSVTSEAGSVTLLNTTLANLELETGTILETHGVRTFEERYCALGPLGGWGKGRDFPSRIRPTENDERYPKGDKPAEEAFDLVTPVGSSPRTMRLPPPDPE